MRVTPSALATRTISAYASGVSRYFEGTDNSSARRESSTRFLSASSAGGSKETICDQSS